jgi:transcriptional regulator with XRE-family HTH domain
MEVLKMWRNSYKKTREGLARNIKDLRGKRGLSQERLALAAQVDRTLISKIERCIANPTLEILVKIAFTLEITLSELLDQ